MSADQTLPFYTSVYNNQEEEILYLQQENDWLKTELFNCQGEIRYLRDKLKIAGGDLWKIQQESVQKSIDCVNLEQKLTENWRLIENLIQDLKTHLESIQQKSN